MSTATKLGKVRCTPRGVYDATATYEFLDIVTSNGSSYMALQNVPVGTAVTNTTYWMVIASKGDKGDKGNKGDKGDTGNGIASVNVVKSGTAGEVDTYTGTITYTDETTATFTFTVTNGSVTSVDGKTGDVSLNNKAEVDGYYETFGYAREAGVAGNLINEEGKTLDPDVATSSGSTYADQPFVQRATAMSMNAYLNDELITVASGIEQWKKEQAFSIVRNQLVKPVNGTIPVANADNCTLVGNNDGTLTLTVSATVTVDGYANLAGI